MSCDFSSTFYQQTLTKESLLNDLLDLAGWCNFSTKFIHGWLPTSSRRVLIEKGRAECPHCNQVEDTDHLFLCQKPKIENQRNLSITFFFAAQIYRVSREGKLVMLVFIEYFKYLLTGNNAEFQPVFAPCTALSI